MLTKSEEQIMCLLWEKGQPLTATEIINLSDEKTWKDSYVHLLINSLMKKELIEVSGFVKTTKNYARSFVPTVTREGYAIRQIKEQKGFCEDEIPALVALLADGAGLETLEKVRTVVEEKISEIQL